MKKALFILFFSVLLVSCGAQDTEETGVSGDVEAEEKHDEILESGILAYMEQMTGKYLSVGLYSDSKEKQQKHINEAITDVRLAKSEIEDQYKRNIPVIQDLLSLGDIIEESLNKLLVGDSSTEYEDSKRIGEIIGDISREYLDGELPSSVKIHTGIENSSEE
ncbi:hypothetical protein [Virgibacillus chiguensis]|uniref:Sporulation lipoprotein YhcN/YlaJ (Spore_YhcN_YlaJ) n=1 Tax=Virgibacillus chiguensis TaxID=411959 RepID=A0A1M5VHR6_9BACI|nr:hypothetical protein [Virgibacillus chiguensis]SHH74614.1 hypothetical protein SAMN05421807_112120 [Virgibacillus chiguensis]